MNRLFTLLLMLAGCGGAQAGPRPSVENEGGSSGTAPNQASGASSFAGAAVGLGGAASAAGGAATSGGAGGSGATPVAEVPRDGVVAADDPRLVFYGRWSRLDPKRPVASWGPVVVKVRFEGTSLSLALEDEQVDLGEEGRGNIYQFSIDGGEFQRLPPPRRATFQLATGLAAGEHEAMLVRRTESKWGTTTFVGFQIDDGARVLPAGRPPRSIEVFGDSISAGLANENTGYYTNETENGYLAFGPLLARRLDAEWRVEARGGGSLYNDFYLPMIPFFDRVLGPANEQNAPAADNFVYSFAEHQPDVLILALGTNDFSEQYPHLEQALYVAKYRGFVQKLRGHYPGAVIFCLAPFKPGAPWDEARTYIAEAVDELADAGVVAVDGAAGQAWLTAEEYVTGDAFHPNLAGHEKIAERLEPIVRAALGW